MKKSILLAVLPALMVISACSAGPKSNNKNVMIEDTLAHEEIFGSIADAEFTPIKLQPNKALGEGVSLYKPTIGFQRKENKDNNNNVVSYSIRFVSAMQSGTDSAKWYRSVHNLNGEVYEGKGKKAIDVEKVYSALNNGGNPAYATSEKAADESHPYDCYAVYCLLNIPTTGLTGYYVDAYLEVKNGSDDPITSTVGSLNIYDTSKTLKYELGNSNRDAAAINNVVVESGNLDGNKVALYDVELKANDKIKFYWINKDALTYTLNTSPWIGGTLQDDFSLSNSELTVLHKGTYKIYLTGGNNQNGLYFQKVIYAQFPSWWIDPNVKGMISDDGGSSSDREMTFIKTLDSGEHVLSAYVDISNRTEVGFFRRGSSDWNWTGRTQVPEDGKNYCTVTGSDSTFSFAWSVYNG